MTVINQENINQYIASSGQTEFSFNFKIFSAVPDEDLKVYLAAPTQTWNDDGAKILPNDYSINISTTGEGGTVILDSGAEEDYILTIVRDLPVTRTSDFGEAGKFTGEAIDTQLDKLTILISQLNSLLEGRGLLYKITEEINSGQTTLPKLEADEFWKANGSANLVAAKCEEESGCSTLRSEIASQTDTAPGTDLVGMYDPEEKKGQTLTDYIEHLKPQKDNIAVVKNSTDTTKQVKIDASNVGTGQTRSLIMPDIDVDLSTLTVSGLPRGYIDGFLMERKGDTGDDTKVLLVGIEDVWGNQGGSAISNSFDLDLKSTSQMSGKVDLAWAAGSGDTIGKLAAGLTFTAGEFYDIALLGKVGSGTIDFGLDTSIDFSNLLSDTNVIAAGYNKVRYIGTIQASLVGDICQFWQNPAAADEFYWKIRYEVGQSEYYKISHTTNQTYPVQLRVPPHCNVIAKMGIQLTSQSPYATFSIQISNSLIGQPDFGTGAFAEVSLLPIIAGSGTITGMTTLQNAYTVDFATDTEGKINYKPNASSSTAGVEIWTRGYINKRGKL